MIRSVTVVMPALNEERNLEAAVRNAVNLLTPYTSDWEILIFNDGSSDATGEIADRLAATMPKVFAIHHATSKNLGGVYRAGIQRAQKEFLIMLPGDNENGSETARRILDRAGEADIIVPYVVNTEVRPWARRYLSSAFVALINLLSGCRLRYYNGTVLHKTERLRSLNFETNGFGYQAEILVALIRSGCSYLEVGVELAQREKSRSSALRLRNFLQVAKFLTLLFFQRWRFPQKPAVVNFR
ncbi:MAG: glycosyltransferase family 2 protein [Bdellovibrionaceae bacterium]|nr:glycosyltransferase family 2 protein [Pseudobdellovibrionaceae bacterium]